MNQPEPKREHLRLHDEQPESLEAERNRLGHEAAQLLTADRSREPGSGFLDLDRIIGPFAPGQLVVVLARQGVGKTTFAMSMAARPCWRERGFVYYPTEEEGAAAQIRYAATMAGVHPGSAVEGLLDASDKDAVALALRDLRKGPYFFRDKSRPSTLGVRMAAHEAASKGLTLLVVDHAHRMALDDAESKTVSLENAVRALKDIAVESRLTLLVMAQARRRQGYLDHMSCPRTDESLGTSAFEQEANTMLGVFRPTVAGLSKVDRQEFNDGLRPLKDALLPNTMGVEVLKFRRNGDKVGERALLHCENGIVTDRSAR